MKLKHQITEDVMIAEFLKAEIDSQRYGSTIKKALGDVEVSIITNPNLNAEDENKYRKWLLGEVRGYGKNKALFENFPSEVNWRIAVFSQEDLQSVMYIDYSYWNGLSNNTRLPMDAAKNVLNNVEIYGVKNDGFRAINSVIKQGKTFPKMIFVSCNENSRIVALEGHARLTAYFIDKEYIPPELEVIIGFSEDFAAWDLY
ncbi:hypothetical protein DVH26_19150 [Paenibacillus sp. H1-7]|uniref:hypothetical protein n=1 Tax=Paenibacillus sp. H1-7 TaxID=2282849 RepID=UPI001EF7BC53|nr:hypothetical protein [Paenibacillus sp. H1-7]ULL16377.1 hypothetical protein DVH26_19150 [Paenibacillus sp. H1-7]